MKIKKLVVSLVAFMCLFLGMETEANVDIKSCVGGQGYVNGAACAQGTSPFGSCESSRCFPGSTECVLSGGSCGHWTACPTCPSTPPCSPSWGEYGDCSEICGPGTHSRSNGCGATQSQACTNGPCPVCGTANRDSYDTTAEVTSANRCATHNTFSNWVDNSGLASDGGKAWTWVCNRTNIPINCLSYKNGKCEYDVVDSPANPPYTTRDEACRFGTLNSVCLVGAGQVGNEILRWKCGTGETSKEVGSFSSNQTTGGGVVPVDYYGPRTGGVGCQCTPVYDYTCDPTTTFTGSCNNNCGGSITQVHQAHKKDTTCFTGEPKVAIGRDEYLAGTQKHCTSKEVDCAACGTQDSEGGVYHETN